jgi:predicted DNA-binding ribbon-helix-helix protein
MEKYKTRSTNVLDDIEIMQENRLKKTNFLISLYEDDLEYCRQNNLNISRIIRLKFHEWLMEKGMIE